ncbi:prolactin regulatory element-binding protein-like [Macrosteles quadrilineatus]|uniref:prolactin regulatory element-binding protein-like n=1 Tax=Macrosteles quadrilineatus TaxID=74068 RepID=UPI0023E0A6CC|nr:prolactin regulatory element-binding protein-like [Macrosteles quadrilineatus]
MPSRNQPGLLARVNFPLYTLQMLTSRHVIVGGGGGSSKTGVANGFEIFELSYNGNRFVVEEMIRHETGPSVVMNCACVSTPKKTYLVAGQESHCQLYLVTSEIVSRKRNISTSNDVHQKKEGGVRRRTTSKSKSSTSEDPPSKINEDHIKTEGSKDSQNTLDRHLEFHIKPADSIQTDFSSEALQRVVRISPSGQLMATGGTDGHVRLWNFPSMKPHCDIVAHHKEIDDLDFSPDSISVASVSKDGKGYIWCVKTGNKLTELEWTPTNGTKYLYKRCRFGRVEEDPKKSRLFLICNPVSRVGKQTAHIQLWDPAQGLRRTAQVEESLSALAVRDDGRFIAVGTMFTGTVDIYIAFSLQRVLHVKDAHSMFVTGLEFLPALGSETSITTVSEAAVVSISVDNKVCIHNLPYRRTLPSWLVVVLIIVTLFFTFVICSYMGL